MRRYYVEKKYTVTECYYIEAQYESDARRISKSNYIEPSESVRGADRITAIWPVERKAKEK